MAEALRARWASPHVPSCEPQIVIAHTSPNRVDCMQSLSVRVASRSDFAITRMRRSSNGHGITEPQQRAEAYAICLHLSEMEDFDVWRDGKHLPSPALVPGALHISDMRHGWRADIRSPFHVVNFYVPQGALDEIAGEHGVSRAVELNCPIGSAQIDAVLTNMTLALLPALASPEQTNRLFVDYAVRAVIVHLARSYGSFRAQTPCNNGGLAPWQERRAKELLLENLSGELCLPELASACCLSTSHFSHAFRQTTGCPPHQWLLAQRVELAKQLILNSKKPLSEIALAAGFADQSHFTRVFTHRTKVSPAAWRRAQKR